MAASSIKSASAAQPVETIEARFRRLADIWERATGHLSSMKAASEHPAYQEIIGLGPEVVPLLLRDLQDKERHWFIALRTITGGQPCPQGSGRRRGEDD
jgi:hypothetical protein